MASERFSFGAFLLDAGSGMLFEHGLPVAIGSKALALLSALVDARGQVVTKSALMDAAWPDTNVEESNLTVQIAALRRRLRCSQSEEDWIATFRGIGYRFAGPLTIDVHDARPAAAPGAAVSGHDIDPCPSAGKPSGTNIEAYDFFVRGRELVMCSPTGNKLARKLLAKAIEIDPEFGGPYACLAISHFGAAVNHGEDIDANCSLGMAYARKAVTVAPADPLAHRALAYVHLYAGKPDEAESAIEAALRMQPDYVDAIAFTGGLRVLQGRPDEAIDVLAVALTLNPFPPGWYYWDLGFAYYAAGRYADAIGVLRREEVRRLPAGRILAASLAQLGFEPEAHDAAREFLELNPGFRALNWASTQAFERSDDRHHFLDGYRKAGLPV